MGKEGVGKEGRIFFFPLPLLPLVYRPLDHPVGRNVFPSPAFLFFKNPRWRPDISCRSHALSVRSPKLRLHYRSPSLPPPPLKGDPPKRLCPEPHFTIRNLIFNSHHYNWFIFFFIYMKLRFQACRSVSAQIFPLIQNFNFICDLLLKGIYLITDTFKYFFFTELYLIPKFTPLNIDCKHVPSKFIIIQNQLTKAETVISSSMNSSKNISNWISCTQWSVCESLKITASGSQPFVLKWQGPSHPIRII